METPTTAGQNVELPQERARSCAGRIMRTEFRMKELRRARVPEAELVPPLLRLPPELRNRIYTLVLGQNDIHVYADEEPNSSATTPVYYTCTAANRSDSKNSHPEWLSHHLPCFQRSSHRLPNVAILSTCRQIRDEASLLSYSANTFMFVGPSSLDTFVSSVLSPSQARALKSMAIWSIMEGPKDSNLSWDKWQPGRAIEQGALSGIMELRVRVSVFRGPTVQAVDWRVGDRLQGLIGFFGSLGLRKVDVAIGLHEEAVLSAQAVTEYTEHITTRLMA